MRPDFGKVIQRGWDLPVTGCSMFQVVSKVYGLKSQFRALYFAHYRDISNEVETFVS